MKPTEFIGYTHKLALAQPKYKPLPIKIESAHDPESPKIRKFTYCYELNDMEIAQIVLTRKMFGVQVGSCFHPVNMHTANPGHCVMVPYKESPGLYEVWVPLSDGSEKYVHGTTVEEVFFKLSSEIADFSAEQFFFYEKPTTAINEQGE